MKKLLVIFLILLSLPCFAGNLLQQEDEVRFAREIAKEPAPNYSKEFLIRQDYMSYINGKNALYGYVVNGIEDAHKFKNPTLNQRYLKLIKNKIDNVLTASGNVNYNLTRIDIDDTDYEKLSDDTKRTICVFNIATGLN